MACYGIRITNVWFYIIIFCWKETGVLLKHHISKDAIAYMPVSFRSELRQKKIKLLKMCGPQIGFVYLRFDLLCRNGYI